MSDVEGPLNSTWESVDGSEVPNYPDPENQTSKKTAPKKPRKQEHEPVEMVLHDGRH